MAVTGAVGAAIVAAVIGSLVWPASDLRFGDTSSRQVPGLALAVPSPSSVASSGPAPIRPACTEPLGWRIASVETWPGGLARVWRATEVDVAAGPRDPSINFMLVAARRVRALGWCAPVGGPKQAPVGLRSALFRLEGGIVTPVEVTLLPTVAPGPLGEVWIPRSDGRWTESWASGRYVIRIATQDGTWVRWLGIEVRAYGASETDVPLSDQRMPGS